LQRVEGAPEFSLPVYLLSSRNCSHPHLQAALEHAARLLPADTLQAATELT
jgi:hypothetical protein